MKKRHAFSLSVTVDEAITLARREMQRRGLDQTHQVTALHGSPDLTAEGAAFAATVSPRAAKGSPLRRNVGRRWKFLIEHDGRVLARRWPSRRAA